MKQIKESREMQGRKKLKANIGVSEISIQTHRISEIPKTWDMSDVAGICYWAGIDHVEFMSYPNDT